MRLHAQRQFRWESSRPAGAINQWPLSASHVRAACRIGRLNTSLSCFYTLALATNKAGSPIPVGSRSLNWSALAHRSRNTILLAKRPELESSMAATSTGSRTQLRTHAGHSHGHGHHHDTTYLTSSNKSDPGVRITRIGLYVNLGMAISKGVGGYVFNSQA